MGWIFHIGACLGGSWCWLGSGSLSLTNHNNEIHARGRGPPGVVFYAPQEIKLVETDAVFYIASLGF